MPRLGQLDGLLLWAHRTIKTGSILVHCRRGYHRAATVMAILWAAMAPTTSAYQVMSDIKLLRRGANINGDLAHTFQELYPDLARWQTQRAVSLRPFSAYRFR